MKKQHWMSKALSLVAFAKGTTSPNPTVGALLISASGEYIGSAVTKKAGSNHAERELLSSLPLSQTKDSTLFVTLEPCSFFGKTPPCTDIIIEKQISTVMIATTDPNPKVSGQGIEILKKAGIKVEVGILEEEAKNLNQDFFYAIKNEKPFVFAKVGLSLDGFMATEKGESQWITGPRARKIGHILRYRADAILVGALTVLSDNPKLNARPSSYRTKTLLRVVLDKDAVIPKDFHVLSDEGPTLWVVSEKWRDHEIVKMVKQNPQKEVFFLKEGKEGFSELLSFLYKEERVVSLMLEGGSQVFKSFLDYGYVKDFFLFYGPLFLGKGLSPFPISVDKLALAPSLKIMKTKMYSGDIFVYAKIC